MKKQEPIVRLVTTYFILATCIMTGMGITGCIIDPKRQLHYDAFFSPLIYAFLGLLPGIVLYSKKELELKAMFFRMILELILIELLILTFSRYAAHATNPELVGVALCILTVYITVHLICWFLDCKQASRLNEDLKSFQNKEK